MNECRINSKSHCKKKKKRSEHTIAKTYYLHKLLYQNIWPFLLHNYIFFLYRDLKTQVKNYTSSDASTSLSVGEDDFSFFSSSFIWRATADSSTRILPSCFTITALSFLISSVNSFKSSSYKINNDLKNFHQIILYL